MAATLLDRGPADVAPGARPPSAVATAWLAGDLPSAQFARFALVGGSANLV